MKNLMKVLLLVAGTGFSVDQIKGNTNSSYRISEKVQTETSFGSDYLNSSLIEVGEKEISEPKKARGMFSNKKNTLATKTIHTTLDQTKELDAKIAKEQIQGQDEKDLADLIKCEQEHGTLKTTTDTLKLY